MKKIEQTIPRHPQTIVGALEFHLERMEKVNFEPSYHLKRMRELLMEMSESIILEQLIASAKERNLFVPSSVPSQVVPPTSGGNPTPLSFSDFEAWPEGEELSPSEKAEIMGYDDDRDDSDRDSIFPSRG